MTDPHHTAVRLTIAAVGSRADRGRPGPSRLPERGVTDEHDHATERARTALATVAQAR